MKKRVLALLLMCTMLAWVAGSALAANFEDTEGTDYEDACITLSTLGILQGYPDGEFKPDNTITRAEFAAVAIRALGLDQAAKYAAGETMFPDVSATHWASGYVNIAVDQGLIRGYPDGTFRPGAEVTYAESIAILVRVLGYEQAVKGTWPTNYLIKGFELGVTDGVQFSAGNPATRGDVALFTDNSLSIPLMKLVTAGDEETWEVDEDSSLLTDCLGFETLDGFVAETGDVLGTKLDGDEAIILDDDGDDNELALAEGLSLTDWLGLEVRAWHDGSTILLVNLLTDEDDLITDWAEDVDEGDGDWFITLGDLEEEFAVDDDAVLYQNLQRVEDVGDLEDEAEVRVLLDDDDVVVSLLAVTFDDCYLVTGLDEDRNEVIGVDANGDEQDLDLDDFEDGYLFLLGGAPLAYEDIEADDVLHWSEWGDYLYCEVARDTVAGELEEVSIDSKDRVVLTIDGEDYKAVTGSATLSDDQNDSFYGAAEEGDFSAFVGEEVTLYLDRDGYVRHMAGDVEVVPDETVVALITYGPDDWGPPGDEVDYIKVVTAAGDSVRYEFDSKTEFVTREGTNTGVETAVMSDLNEGEVVKVELGTDGTVDKVTEYDFSVPWTEEFEEDDVDGDYDRFYLGDKWYRGSSGTAVFDLDWTPPADPDQPMEASAVTWADFRNISFTGSVDAALYADDSKVKIIVFDGSTATSEVSYGPEDIDAGVVVKRGVTGDGYKLTLCTSEGTVLLYEDDDTTVTSLVYDNWADDDPQASWTDIDVDDLVQYELASDGETLVAVTELGAYEFGSEDDPFYAWIQRKGIDSDNLILDLQSLEDDEEEDFQAILNADTVIFDVSGDDPEVIDIDDLRAGDKVQIFCDNDDLGTVLYVKRVED